MILRNKINEILRHKGVLEYINLHLSGFWKLFFFSRLRLTSDAMGNSVILGHPFSRKKFSKFYVHRSSLLQILCSEKYT